MLVLSRKLGEKIWIGDQICVTVVQIDRGKIRLGIDAPRDVPIYRQKILPLKRDEQQTELATPMECGYCQKPVGECQCNAIGQSTPAVEQAP